MKKQLDEKQVGNSLQRVVSMLDPDTVKKGDFIKHFKKVIDHVKEMKKKNMEDMERISKALTEASKNVKNTTQSDFKALKESITALNEKNLSGLNKSLEKKIMDVDRKLTEIRNGEDGKDADEEMVIAEVLNKLKKELTLPEIVDVKKDLPKMGNEIRDALELLQDEDRLDVSAIKGLEKKFKELDKRMSGMSTAIYQQGGSSSGGKVVKALDLSDQLDGSTRVFNIQNVWRVISVHLTSSPTIMREGVDYNWSAGNSTITFTSEVSDLALSSGQSLIIVVAE